MTFRGWHMTSFTAYDSVREKVNGILALEIMGFAILAAAASTSCRAGPMQTLTFRRRSSELRQLNARLQLEIAEREKGARSSRSPSRPWRSPQARGPGRDVGRGQSRAEPALGRDEDLPGRRAPPP